ncbi:MAG: tRNA lysidine(34) synthetase TilS [Prevotellaceae bacterium]|jgi:tRNA(Ile)-lysidine synthase|nr:tRNA lysidine(34) synthetase TilS [Prevotellaceae bacterium]
MLLRLQKFVEQHQLFTPHDHILVGVSGGVDSVALLHLLLCAKYKIAVAHCNFSLRGEESDGDEDFVRALCTKNNLPFFTTKFNTEEYAKAQGVSIQMAARALRYQWFEQVASENSFTKIAVAHNLNDDVETFFINLARGTGLQGLQGISPLQNKLVRPLLFATREEIVRYATQHSIGHREDSSNSSTKYARNFIRHQILPEFAQLNPSFLQSMQQNMARISSAQQAIESVATEIKKRCCTEVDGNLHISISALPEAQREFWLYELLQDYNFSGDVVKNIAQSLDGISGKKFYSPTHALIKDRDLLIVSLQKNSEQSSISIAQSEVDAGVQIPLSTGKTLALRVVHRSEVDFSLGENVAFLSYENLQFPLALRGWQSGDSFVPLGMSGEQKLSDFFVNIKLSIFEKSAQLLLCCASGSVAWVLGRRVDNRFRVRPEAQKILRAEIIS